MQIADIDRRNRSKNPKQRQEDLERDEGDERRGKSNMGIDSRNRNAIGAVGTMEGERLALAK
jgi:hypothetical protein